LTREPNPTSLLVVSQQKYIFIIHFTKKAQVFIQWPNKCDFLQLVNEPQNAVGQMCETKRKELNKKEQGNIYTKYWHGIAIRVCVTKMKTTSGRHKDEFLVVQGSIATSYSDTVLAIFYSFNYF
jgi:hypothetical protein